MKYYILTRFGGHFQTKIPCIVECRFESQGIDYAVCRYAKHGEQMNWLSVERADRLILDEESDGQENKTRKDVGHVAK